MPPLRLGGGNTVADGLAPRLLRLAAAAAAALSAASCLDLSSPCVHEGWVRTV